MTGPGGVSKRGSHRLAEVSHCARKWYFRWAKGLVPKKTAKHFIEGTLVHLALAYYRAEQMAQVGKAPAWFTEQPSMDLALEKEGEGYPEAIELAKDILKAYRKNYDNHDLWEPVSMEEEFTATIGQIRKLVNPYAEAKPDDGEVVSSRIDFLYRTAAGLWACDYKTTAHGYRGRLSDWNPDGEYGVPWQFMVQTAILRVNFGDQFRGVVVERILKKPPYDFDRNVVKIPRSIFMDMPEIIARQCAAEREIARSAFAAQQAGANMDEWLPLGNPWSCYSWGHPCEYRNLCTAETEGTKKDVASKEYSVVG